MQQAKPVCRMLHVGCLFGLLFNSEDDGDIFLQIVG
jgi:hypothetical protein